ncbi:YqaJ viral recombinase family protein [Tenacibaculum maritimum]|nr:YqaJ viral recombinase family protein [Tenacibaculum maritimum]
MNKPININLEELRAEHESALNSLKADKKKEEWLEKKRGKFSSSEAGRLMTYEDKINTFPKGADAYVLEKVIEILTHKTEEGYTDASMRRGNDNEKAAMERFMKETGIEVYNYGEDQEFITLGSNFGCTPDGLIGEDGGAETKCPDSKTHFIYLKIKTVEEFKKICKKYYWQIQTSMYVTGRQYWYFISFDDRFKDESKQLYKLKIPRCQEDIDKFKIRLTEAIKKKINN